MGSKAREGAEAMRMRLEALCRSVARLLFLVYHCIEPSAVYGGYAPKTLVIIITVVAINRTYLPAPEVIIKCRRFIAMLIHRDQIAHKI